MTWEELTQLLTELAHEQETEAKVIREPGLEAVFLHLVPVAWFSSMKFTNALNMGMYEGEINRLVGTEQIPLAEVTPEFVREKVKAAAVEQFSRLLDPVAVAEFLERHPRPKFRDVEDAG